MAHSDEFEKRFGWLRSPGATNLEKYKNYSDADHNQGIDDNLEISDGGMVYLTKPIEKMSRLEATNALLGVAMLNTTNREELMEELLYKANLPEKTHYQILRAQHDPKKTVNINPEEVLESLNDPDPYGSRKGIAERSRGKNEIKIDSEEGVFADFGVATLRHSTELQKALKCAAMGDEKGLKSALGASRYVRRNYSDQLNEILQGKLSVDSETLDFLGLPNQSASNTVIEVNTDEDDPYSGQFSSNDWMNWK
jgi:hypothetical protein